MAPRSLIVT